MQAKNEENAENISALDMCMYACMWLVEVEFYLPVTLFTQKTFSPEWVSWFSPRIAAGACQFATGLNRWKPSISF
jgi:hypothetical protein